MGRRDFILALLVIIIWGANFTVVKLGLEGIPSMLLISLRYTITAIPAVFFIKRPKLEWKYIILYGLTVGVGQFACLFYAIEIGMPPGLSSIVVQVQAFISPFLAWLILKERLYTKQLIGFLAASVGLAIIGLTSISGITRMPLGGFILTIGAAIFWAASNIVVRFAAERSFEKGQPLDMLGLIVWGALVPPIPLLLFALILYDPNTLVNAMINLGGISIFAILYLALGCTLFGYVIWSQLIAKYSVGKIAPLSLLIPITGLLTARLVLSEQLTTMQWLGVVIVLAGLIIADLDFEPIVDFFKAKKQI
ncbi:MAG TPA: EamA family transporter [Tepidimicrobium sp.]|nr:EamA family transporter [Tepidimicrobium sp.]